MKPAYLQAGDEIIIIATAKKIAKGEIDGAISEIKSWGFEVIEGPNLYSEDRQFSGTKAQRASDLQWALNHPTAKAVIFARGGYGTVHLIDQLDFTTFKKHPKWLCGFSDLTALHSHVFQNTGIETLHSSMPIFFKDSTKNIGSESLRKTLFGEQTKLEWESHPLNRNGETSGELVGGNLSVLYSITGSESSIDTSGKILFLEDLTEYFYHLDRMMMQLKRSGKLDKLAGLIVGQFTEMIDNPVPFGKTAEEIILEAVSEYDFPVTFNAPIGHVLENEAVYHGRKVNLSVGQTTCLEF